ncbi:citrate-proton symporter [Actinomadura meridiana]|uniref:Citrate-proton symporter n=1 Tax=Actinomadura meridiana TaxID=559626 RepID=A0ABP8C1A5_9ACTN
MTSRPGSGGVSRPPSVLRSVLACNYGVCFEGFDFIVYSAFSRYISHHFFPAENEAVSTLLTLGTFGVSYVVRPLGGLVWGRLADRYGRRPVLVWIALMMSIGVALIALTPSYATIGWSASVLVMVARVIQGFAAGGEFGGATAMLVELAPERRRGLFASTQMATQAVTAGLASAAVLLLDALLSPEALADWGWRLVFGFGVLLAPIGLYMRRRMAESPEYLRYSAEGDVAARTSLVRVFRDHPREVAMVAGLTVVGSASFYLLFVFLPSHAGRKLHIDMMDVQKSVIVAAALQVAACLAGGALSDRYGRRPVLLAGAIGYGVLCYPAFALLNDAPTFGRLVAAQAMLSVAIGLLSGAFPAAISELFSPETRSSGVGLVYNLVGGVFGGLGPFLITSYMNLTGDTQSPAYWALLTGLVGVAAALTIRPRRATTVKEAGRVTA